MDIILASNSPRRKEILSMLDIDFRVYALDVDENIDVKEPGLLVTKLAKMKAKAVYEKFPDSIIIAGDTVVAYGDHILGKPKDKSDAKAMLKMLSGNAHSVYSGYCVMYKDNIINDYEKTTIEFDCMNEQEIEDYLKTGEYKDKAGAYAIQGKAAKFIKSINGCYYNVVGMPINSIYRALKKIYL